MTIPVRKMHERVWLAPGAGARVPFALKDFREALFKAYDAKPHGLLIALIKQSTRGAWPTVLQLRAANLLLAERDLPLSECTTRDRVTQRKPTEPTPAEVRAKDVAAYDAMSAARPLKPPRSLFSYETVPSDVFKLRVKDARPDRDGFNEAFWRDRR